MASLPEPGTFDIIVHPSPPAHDLQHACLSVLLEKLHGQETRHRPNGRANAGRNVAPCNRWQRESHSTSRARVCEREFNRAFESHALGPPTVFAWRPLTSASMAAKRFASAALFRAISSINSLPLTLPASAPSDILALPLPHTRPPSMVRQPRIPPPRGAFQPTSTHVFPTNKVTTMQPGRPGNTGVLKRANRFSSVAHSRRAPAAT
jgi:hypothetical protein